MQTNYFQVLNILQDFLLRNITYMDPNCFVKNSDQDGRLKVKDEMQCLDGLLFMRKD